MVPLRTKFGEEGSELLPAIAELDDAEKYLTLIETIINAATFDEIRRAVAKAAAPARRPKKGANGKRGSANA